MDGGEVKLVSNGILLGEVSRMLAEGKSVILKTKGYSMLPFIHGGFDSVRMSRHDDVSVGDVVLARIVPDHYLIHRVFSIDGDAVTLMGDGNLKGKEYCSLSDVLGTVDAIVSPGGRERKVADGRMWRWLLPVRRYLVAFHRRIVYPISEKIMK